MKRRLLHLVDKVYKYSALHKNLTALKNFTDWQHKENQCLQYLLHFIGNNHFLANTSMSMSPIAICHILNEIVINDRQSIIEFGAGNSTIYIAKLLSTIDKSKTFFSVESDEKWIEIVQSNLAKRNLQHQVQFIYAPIIEQRFDNTISKSFKWYDSEALKKSIASKQFDLIVVDGPQGNLCPFSRYPALLILREYLSTSYSIFLDDTNRKDERFIFEKWCEILDTTTAIDYKNYATIFNYLNYTSQP